jgi:hypothetical protein
MQVELSFEEYTLLIGLVRQKLVQVDRTQQEALLGKLLHACHTVPAPRDTRDETEGDSDTFIRHQRWNQNLYRFVEPSDWAAAVAAQRRSESTGEADIDSADSPVK